MPGFVQGGEKFDNLVSNIDILPTLLDLTNIPKPKDLQGKSFAGLLMKKGIIYEPRDHINAELTFHDMGFNAMRCIRTKKWKYIRNLARLDVLFEMPNDILHSKSGKVYHDTHPEYNSSRPDEELYDLESDPEEIINLANNPKYANIKKDLSEKLMKFLEDTNDPALTGEIKEPKRPEEGLGKYIYDLEVEK
jgi:arylsulfatase A-like enzyme